MLFRSEADAGKVDKIAAVLALAVGFPRQVDTRFGGKSVQVKVFFIRGPTRFQCNAEGARVAGFFQHARYGQTKYHEQLERELAEFVGKPDAFLLNFGYQGMISIIDCLLTPRDVVVYDAEAHACIIDGLRMHKGKRFVYGHNDMASLRLQLKHATELAEQQNGGVLVITEGVFGMKGDLGKLDEIVALKKDFQFRLLVDDAHGFGTMEIGRAHV